MTDDPGHDYDVWCAQRDAEEDPGCEECDGTGYGDLPGADDWGHPAQCQACDGSGRERDAIAKRESERYVEENVRWAETWGPLLLGEEWEKL